jgi:ankyrin repeat protein
MSIVDWSNTRVFVLLFGLSLLLHATLCTAQAFSHLTQIEYKYFLDQRDKNGRTCLHLATLHNQVCSISLHVSALPPMLWLN